MRSVVYSKLPLLQTGGNQRVGCLRWDISVSTRSPKTSSYGYCTTGSLIISNSDSIESGSLIIQTSNQTISD